MSARKKSRKAMDRTGTAARLNERKANILKALAHPVRIGVFEALAEGEKTVGELVEMLGEKDANGSRHLAVMRAAGLVSTRKEGLNVFYSIKLPCLVSMLSCLDDGVCEIADEHGEMARLLRARAAK